MAGKRQHYIPQFLLKGFSSKIEGNKHFIWYFLKETPSKEVSVKDVALSKKFYGKPGAGTLDETITNMENQFGPAIERSKRDGGIAPSDIPTIIEFVVNMVIRTRYIRIASTDAFRSLTEMAARNFSDPQKTSRFLTENIKRDKTYLKDELQSSIRNELQKKLGMKIPYLEKVAIDWAENNIENIINLNAPFFSNGVVKGLTNFYEGIEKQGAQLHKDALEKIFDKEELTERHRKYHEMQWIIHHYNPNTFILGDICVIEMDIESQEFRPSIFNKKQNNYIVLLPIAHHILLVGSISKTTNIPCPEIINTNSIKISTDFFIANVNNERERSYHRRIGCRASWWDKEIKQIEKDYFDRL